MCNCWSVGLDGPVDETDKDKPVVIDSVFFDKPFNVDYCIADAVKKLLDRAIITTGSCCGHNRDFGLPSILIDNPLEYDQARKILNDAGFSNIWLKAWVLTDLDNL